MILLVFVASVLVAVLLERQARQHALERTLEYEKLGLPVPLRPPRLKRTEAWLNVGLGFVLLGLSAAMVSSAVLLRTMAERIPEHAAEFSNEFSLAIQNAAFFLASGIALAWLGWKAVREIARFNSRTAPRIHGT